MPRPVEGVWAAPPEELLGTPVADGVWVSALPFPTPLMFSFSYLVDTADGLVVVDLGWDSDESWRRFLSGLGRAGKTVDDVSGVVVTHVHPDHYGLAARLRQVSDAWIGAHPGERPQLAVDHAAAQRRIEDMDVWLRRCGAPDEEIQALWREAAGLEAAFPSVVPDVELLDRGPVRGTEGALVALHTPGHTPGHLCFHDRERGVVFTGDHALPRITPNVSKRPTSDDDPLLDFTASLQGLQTLDTDEDLLALPGHEWAFGGVRQRAAEIEGHHVERLEEVADAVRSGCATVWEAAAAISWSRPFAQLSHRARRSAIGETYAHLYRLDQSGTIRLTQGLPERWAPTELTTTTAAASAVETL